jgi:hypothetical protein
LFGLSFAAVLALVAIAIIVPRNMFLTGLAERTLPGLIPSSSFARNLDSNDNDLVRESLYFLTNRKDPIGVPKALTLLESDDDYIWLNAALYTGACGHQDAVPYLIKALRHTAWRADPKNAECLRQLTKEEFGQDFGKWQGWWLEQHPNAIFDWESHLGHAPRFGTAKK